VKSGVEYKAVEYKAVEYKAVEYKTDVLLSLHESIRQIRVITQLYTVINVYGRLSHSSHS